MKISLGAVVGAITSGILWATFAVAAHHFDTSALFFGGKAYSLLAVIGLIFGLIIGAIMGGLITGLGLSFVTAVLLSAVVYSVIGVPLLFTGGVFYPKESFVACIIFIVISGVINGALVSLIAGARRSLE